MSLPRVNAGDMVDKVLGWGGFDLSQPLNFTTLELYVKTFSISGPARIKSCEFFLSLEM